MASVLFKEQVVGTPVESEGRGEWVSDRECIKALK